MPKPNVTRVQSATIQSIWKDQPKYAHIVPLAHKRLSDNGGLNTVLQSVATYRNLRFNHIGWKPSMWCDVAVDKEWLLK